jgi:hypothetical protein
MITIDITSDIDQAEKDVADFFRKQMRFVMLMSINSTARDVQKHLRDVTIPGSWTVRNKALARAMTTFVPDAGAGQGGLFTTQNFLTAKSSIVIGPAAGKNGHLAGEGFSERQVTGATKVPKGSAIAVPNEGPGLKRLSGGSIPSAKKPKNLRGNPKFFVKGKAIYERMGVNGDKLRLRYGLGAQAKGTTALVRFYPDAYATVDRVFPNHFDVAMTKAIANSRFKND